MIERPRYLGINEFVAKLAEELVSTPLSLTYDDEAVLRADAVKAVEKFTQARIPRDFFYHIIREDDEEMTPVSVFGAEFRPDILVEVEEFPVVALDIEMIKPGDSLAGKLSAALGRALVCCRSYPAFLIFVWTAIQTPEHRIYFDWEFKADLWAKHKIKLVIRES